MRTELLKSLPALALGNFALTLVIAAAIGGLVGLLAAYPALRLFSLPSIQGNERRHLELGVEGVPVLVDRAMEDIRLEVERRGITWRWRDG